MCAGRGFTRERRQYFLETAIIRGERRRCASGGTRVSSGDVAMGCPNNSELCKAGGTVDSVRVPGNPGRAWGSRP